MISDTHVTIIGQLMHILLVASLERSTRQIGHTGMYRSAMLDDPDGSLHHACQPEVGNGALACIQHSRGCALMLGKARAACTNAACSGSFEIVRHITAIATKYDYRDAEDRVEQLREWYESDPHEETVELPAIDRAVPASVRRRPLSRRGAVKVAEACADRAVRSLIEAVLELDKTSSKAKRPELSPEAQEALMDCNPPLPSLLAVFERHDAIEGCFDDESQGMLECTPEPNTVVPFRIADIESVRSAFRTLAVICDTLTKASRVISRIMPTDMDRTGGHIGPAS